MLLIQDHRWLVCRPRNALVQVFMDCIEKMAVDGQGPAASRCDMQILNE